MTHGKRRTRVEHGLNITRKLRAGKPCIWYVYAFRGGPQIYTCEGDRPVITKAILDAAAKARQDARVNPSNSLDALIDAYRQSPEWAKLGARTKRDYEQDLAKVSAKFGSVPLPVFDDRRMRSKVMEWRKDMAAHPRTADRAIVMLATLLGWGVNEAKLAINVAAGIPALYSSNRAAIIWTDADWQAIQPHCSKHVWQALRLASLTGLRLGDLVDLEWSHIGTQSIVFTTSKRKRRVVIPILRELRQLLNEIGGTGHVLKNSRGQPWTESGLGGVFQKAKNAAKDAETGFNHVLRIHDLRGTYVTWLANQGLTDQEIARIVAWSEKQVAEIRRRYVDEQHVVSSLVERLNQKAIK